MTRFLRGALAATASLCLLAQPALAQPRFNFGGVVAYDATADALRQMGTPLAVSGTITTPAGTTAYSSGQLIANNATAGSVTPIQFTACLSNQGAGSITAARISTPVWSC